MASWPITADRLRAMYAGGRGNAAAGRLSRLRAAVFALGLMPRRWVTLEVPGRRSGKLTRFPLAMAGLSGQWHLAPMLGERCNWVQNMRAVFRVSPVPDGTAGTAVSHPPRKRHWWRWILAGVAALVVLVIVAASVFIKLQPALAPLGLPAGRAAAPSGPLDGTWHVASGSAAGFRVRESFLWIGNDTVGRTAAVRGTAVISGQQVTGASFRVDLTAITVNGKTQPQVARSLSTQADPVASITLLRPVTLNPAFVSGATVSVTVQARLTLNGVSRRVTFPVSGRRDGTQLQLAGAIPVAFSAWHITGPAGFGFLGSLASHGVAEFLLILSRAG